MITREFRKVLETLAELRDKHTDYSIDFQACIDGLTETLQNKPRRDPREMYVRAAMAVGGNTLNDMSILTGISKVSVYRIVADMETRGEVYSNNAQYGLLYFRRDQD